MRKKRVYKKYHKADVTHGRVEIGRFINCVMRDGKKSIAERLVYNALDKVKTITKEEPLTVFDRAIENASPVLETASRRVGGANYQVPIEVRPERRFIAGDDAPPDRAALGHPPLEATARLGDRVVLLASRPGRVAEIFPVSIPRPRPR